LRDRSSIELRETGIEVRPLAVEDNSISNVWNLLSRCSLRHHAITTRLAPRGSISMLGYALQVAVLLLPLCFIVVIARARDADRLRWLLRVLYSAAFIAYVSMVGRWDLVSVYARYALAIALVAVAAISFRKVRDRPLLEPGWREHWIGYVAPTVVLGVFVCFAAWAVRGYFHPGEAIELRFPLREGRYYIGHGGDSSIVNYHNPIPAQRYALDIVALNAAGARAVGLYPRTLTDYAIFGRTVHSPCDGRVVQSVDGLPDQTPPTTDRTHIAGNHVVIACGEALVLLAHLQRGSVGVHADSRLMAGDQIGRVGNSGNTSEPHLHIHAVRGASGDALKGEGAPIAFEGRFPVRNRVFHER
jgi:hypothetical protein